MKRRPSTKQFSPVLCAILASGVSLHAQERAAQSSPVASVQRGVRLVETGRCKEALLLLERGLPRVTDKALRYHAEMATVRCAMAVDDEQIAADMLFQLGREFPGDPEVLYVETHLFSEIGMRAAQVLQTKDPESYQARRLQAEALESQGRSEEAAAIYRGILKENPKLPGVHYRLGQIDLALAGDAGQTDAAKQEFEAEIAVDPTNASAEFVLGELARRKGVWDEAIRHFSRAAELDSGFLEAYLALGMSLTASGRYIEAKSPLEHYVKLAPDDPAGHYQLALAYSRTGDQADARREMALQAQAAARNKSTDTAQGHAVRQ